MTANPTPPASSDAETAAPAHAPLAFVVDSEVTIRQFISLILQGHGVDTIEFADGGALRKGRFKRAPDLIFLDVNVEVQDAIQSVDALGKAGYTGVVQLMSGRGAAVLDTVRQVGQQYKLNMLPPLKKPFETSAIQRIVFEQKLGHRSAPADIKIGLAEALDKHWLEFWYQPKIDLRRKQLAGAEAFARVRHPLHGVLPPGAFMSGADDAALIALAEQGVVSALKSGLNLSRLGVNLRMAVNVSITALVKLPVGDIVRTYRPQTAGWPGLVFDIAEEQIVNEIGLANEMTQKFAEHNVKLAIDDFGKGYATLMKLKELPFAEMKLDRAFVAGVGTDKVHAPICKTVIDLAHSFGSLAVGIGLEHASDAMALLSMGCDLGQGFLLGQPMPEERFIGLLKQRVMVRQSEATGTAA
jgi:EAL domain-containing protein (putative c-di-GMP-specific phosphodiesterase class I)/CheY-like chemotaxis protein